MRLGCKFKKKASRNALFMQNRTFGQGFGSATLITNKVPVMKPYISSNVTGYIYPGRRRGGGGGEWKMG